MNEHYPYDVFNANAPGGWRPRENSEPAVADNIDPYHDGKGRFTTKDARPGAMGNATGHFTLYDGFTNVDGIHHDYWAQSKHIYFWKLPFD